MNKKSIWIVAVVVVILIIIGLYRGNLTPHQSIKIGALIPLTGSFANLGEDIQNAMEIAKNHISEEKGIDFQFVFEDSAGDPKKALPSAQKLINLDKVDIIIAGPGSSSNLAVAPSMESSQTLFFAISSTQKLNSSGKYIIKLQHDIDTEVASMAKYLFDKGYKKVAVLYDSSSDTLTTGKDVFKDVFEKLGGMVVATEGYDSKAGNDFRTQLTKVKGSNPDALYYLAIDKINGPLVKQTKELAIDQPIFGFSGSESEEFIKGAGESAEGFVYAGIPFSCDGTEAMKKYCEEYSVKFNNRVALQYGAHAYDLLNLLADNIKNNNGVIDKVKIIESFESKKYDGISGDLNFDSEGNIRDREFVFRTVKDGQFVEVK